MYYNITLRQAMYCNITLRQAMYCNITLRQAMYYNITLRQAMYYNIILRHVPAIIVAVEKQMYHIVTVCRLRYPVCNSSYCQIWPAWLYDIFPHSQKRHDFQ
jgi:hypothetical protein